MAVMKSDVSAGSDEYRRNRKVYDERIADLAALMDPGSPFLEFCQLAGEGMYDVCRPAAVFIRGVGMVSGRACARR
jgi:3-methylcrotonyl-CoA carboxylase beta subunit